LKVILDSDVLIDHFRSGSEAALLAQLADRTQWYLSSVVAMELRSGCRSRRDVRLLDKFFHSFERTGRVVYPSHRIWLRAGIALAELGRRPGVNATRRKNMANDALIALSAASIGAAVVTRNATDFQALARVMPLLWFRGVEEALAAMR
jgi:predicted nucleic acid-binding protein